MRRTVLGALAVACAAVLAGGGAAVAETASPVPSVRPSESKPPQSDPTARPAPSESAVPSAVPAESDVPREAASPVPTRVPEGGQVSVVPRGAPDTGAVSPDGSGTAGAVGGAAAAVLAAGGTVAFVVRRRRASGA